MRDDMHKTCYITHLELNAAAAVLIYGKNKVLQLLVCQVLCKQGIVKTQD